MHVTLTANRSMYDSKATIIQQHLYELGRVLRSWPVREVSGTVVAFASGKHQMLVTLGVCAIGVIDKLVMQSTLTGLPAVI